tara:strand:- start:11770 stop:12069 length:300 start_codon:yes stop_codon:yes gene_type:complete
MIIYVDIDETICYYDGVRAYEKALPNHERIKKINERYDNGDTVVYWTARGGTTGIDWTELTKEQLNRWGAKHTELKMWKPPYDIFICDKAINSDRFFNT